MLKYGFFPPLLLTVKPLLSSELLTLVTQNQEIRALLLHTLQLVNDLGQRAPFLCALVFSDTFKKI